MPAADMGHHWRRRRVDAKELQQHDHGKSEGRRSRRSRWTLSQDWTKAMIGLLFLAERHDDDDVYKA
jgi:hypothetical protein